MAFVFALNPVLARPRQRAAVCKLRMSSGDSESEEVQRPMPKVSNDSASPGRKLVRNVADVNQFAEASAGDMANAPKVGEGMGPRRGNKEKKVTRAAAIQKSQSFADAWAEQNQGRVDVWLIIGAVTLLTPLLILVWGVASGVIPTGGLFDN